MSKRGWILFAAMGVIWGIPYLLIKVAVEEVSPAFLVLARTSIAALLLMPIALARGQVRPLFPRWKPLALFAVIEICVPWLMLGFAEQQISSSLTGLLIAAVPLVGALLARYGPAGDALDGRRVVDSWSAWPAWPRWSASRCRSMTYARCSPSPSSPSPMPSGR